MKILKLFLLFYFLVFFSSCGTVKKAFSNQKKNSSDEFLVEKKSPLVMPPDYNELPVPLSKKNQIVSKKNKIKDLISEDQLKEGNNNSNNFNNENLEKSLLEKIKKN